MALLLKVTLFTLFVLNTAQNLQFPNLQYGEISCQSPYNGPNQCFAPGRIVEAWLTEQNTVPYTVTGKCRVYTTFGFVANYLWVRNGCGGRFTIVYQPSAQYTTPYPYHKAPWVIPQNNCQTGEVNIFCFSTSTSNQVCRVPLLVEKVNFRRGYAGFAFAGPCQENYGYGISRDQSAIWTNRGCQGTFDVMFRICPMTSQTGCRTFTAAVRCGNGAFLNQECRVPVDVTSVRLLPTVISNSANTCVENVSFGRDPNGVRVAPGCRGEFGLSYRICEASSN